MEEYLQYIGSVMGAAALTGATAMATSLYMSTLPPPFIPNVDLSSQSKTLPGTDSSRCSRFYPDGKLLEYIYDDARTLYDIFPRGHKVSENGKCLGWRKGKNSEYQFISYKMTLDKIQNFASGLMHVGVSSGQSSYIGIFSRNCVEWVITEQACYRQNCILVPLYDTLGPDASSFILNQTEIEVVICDKEDKVKELLSHIAKTPTLKHIICMDKISDPVKKLAQENGVTTFQFRDIEELGKIYPSEAVVPQPSDIATVCYTSGTTGNPKGVLLSHGAVIACCSSVVLMMGIHGPKPSDVFISYLPLAHMFERVCQVICYMCGGSVGFFQGSIQQLTDDIKELQPTFIPAVPRLLNRIYDKIQSSVSGNRMKKWLMDMALQSKQAELERHIITNRSVWDRFVFRPVQESLGGRVRILVTGSAPLASNVMTFLRCALGCMIVEGYGQTECVGPATLTMFGDCSVGHVGPPLPCCHIKLVDVPEMNYFAINGQGEVCIRGHNVFQGYHKDPEKTAETIDEEGWLHTGDIGIWMENGTLRIVDRKKNIFKLAQGEYIAPEKIENIYLCSPFAAQLFVHGESLKSCLVAIVVPDRPAVLNWAKLNDLSQDWEVLCKNKAVKKMLLDDIVAIGKTAGLKSFEQVKDIFLYSGTFTVEDGLLTPTLKTRRNDCRKFFSTQIEEMYRHLI